MTRINLIFILITTLSCNIFGQQCDSCRKEFDKLLMIRNKLIIDKTDLETSWQITQKLYSLKYFDYIDRDSTGIEYLTHSLTKIFSDICIKANNKMGVDYYFNYLDYTSGSAEEERSFGLERLFVKNPEIVLNEIGIDYNFLDQIVWGFLNNRYYGALNPYEENDYTTMTVYENEPKPVLNKENCRSIFFETNPIMKTKYNEFKKQIDYIINTAIESLEENE